MSTTNQELPTVETKHYISHAPKSGYIDTNGKRHIFEPYGRVGRLSTNDPDLIAELDKAIKVGGRTFYHHDASHDIPQYDVSSVEEARKQLLVGKAIEALTDAEVEKIVQERMKAAGSSVTVSDKLQVVTTTNKDVSNLQVGTNVQGVGGLVNSGNTAGQATSQVKQ